MLVIVRRPLLEDGDYTLKVTDIEKNNKHRSKF